MHKGVSQYVDGTLPKPTSDNVSASDISSWEAMDRKFLADILMGVDDRIMYQIWKSNTCKESWDTLKNLYGKVSEEYFFKIKDELVSLDPKTFHSI